MPAVSEKKRKRPAEKNDRPAKKVAIGQPTRPVKLAFLDANDQLGPVVGMPPHLSAFSFAKLTPQKQLLRPASPSSPISPSSPTRRT